MMPQGPILMTRPVKPKPKNQLGLTGLAIRMGPWGIIQECCMMHLVICLKSCRTFRSLRASE